MKSTKITPLNAQATVLNQLLVTAEKYNNLKEDFDALHTSDIATKADTISEVTSGAGVKIDNVQMLDGGIRHANMISYHGVFINENIQQDLTTTFAGPNTAVSISAYYTAITTGAGGSNALTLAAAAMPGVLKKIKLVVDAADAAITVSGSVGLTTITLDDAGDYVVLISMQDLGWRCIENSGATLA